MTRFRVIDFETSGWPPAASVCEVGFTDVTWTSAEDAVIHPSVSLICKPSHLIDIEAMAVHGITEEMVKDKPSHRVALDKMLEHANQKGVDVWVAHHNEFERKFFNPTGAKWICTYKSALSIWPEAPKHTNAVLMYYLGLHDRIPEELRTPLHRAGPDTYVTAHILVEALKKRSLESLLEATQAPVIMQTVPFGKHKGKKWSDVPRDYLQWLLSQPTVQPDVRSTCEHYLRQR